MPHYRDESRMVHEHLSRIHRRCPESVQDCLTQDPGPARITDHLFAQPWLGRFLLHPSSAAGDPPPLVLQEIFPSRVLGPSTEGPGSLSSTVSCDSEPLRRAGTPPSRRIGSPGTAWAIGRRHELHRRKRIRASPGLAAPELEQARVLAALRLLLEHSRASVAAVIAKHVCPSAPAGNNALSVLAARSRCRLTVGRPSG
jgi:hypothetical protein